MKNVPFIAFIDSQMHLNAFKAFYYSKIEEGEKLTGEIIIRKVRDQFTIDKEELSFAEGCSITWRNSYSMRIFSKLNSTKQEKIKNLIKFLFLPFPENKKKNKFYLITIPPVRLRINEYFELAKRNGNARVEVVVLEEGLRTYIKRIKQSTIILSRLNKVQRFFSIIKYWIRVQGKNAILQRALKRNKRITYFYLLKKQKGKWIRNDQVCNAFAKIYGSNPLMEGRTVDYHNTVLINPTPIFELADSNQDIECFRQVKKLTDSLGMKLVLKPHPREKHLERYREIGIDVDSVNTGISQEELLARSNNKPAAIVGFYSTSLVTANLFWGIPAITLGKMVDSKEKKIEVYCKDMKRFMKRFQNMLDIPSGADELRELLVGCSKRTV